MGDLRRTHWIFNIHVRSKTTGGVMDTMVVGFWMVGVVVAGIKTRSCH
jgi:hypothetical protein